MDTQINLANVVFTGTEIYMLIQIFSDLREICSIIKKNKNSITTLDPVSRLINPVSTNLEPPVSSLDPLSTILDGISTVINNISTALGPVDIQQPSNTPITTLKSASGAKCYVYPPPITVPGYVKCDSDSWQFFSSDNCWVYTSLVKNRVMYGWKIETNEGGYTGYDFGEDDNPNYTADGLISFDYSDGQGASCIDQPITWRSRKIPDDGEYTF